MMKRICLIVIVASLGFYGKGQNLTFSPAVTSSQDTSVKSIAQLWESYCNARFDDYLNTLQNHHYKRQLDAIESLYWYNKSSDLLGFEMEKFMLFGHFFTFSIRKYSETMYEIHTLVQVKNAEGEVNVLHIYKVGATRTDDGFKLVNYFDIYKPNLQNYISENVDFHYPCGFNFDIEKVKDTEIFINQFNENYNIKKRKEKILCIIGNNLNESNAFIGFDFTVVGSENRFAGYFLEPRMILTQRQDHIHEFVHVLIKSTYPDVYNILDEGVATYYGGTAGSDYTYHRENLQKYSAEKAIDFSDPSALWAIKTDETPVAYVVGALIVDYTLKNYGTNKVIELLSCEDYETIFSKLGIEKEGINDFINRLLKR